jgi:hypothetical protein
VGGATRVERPASKLSLTSVFSGAPKAPAPGSTKPVAAGLALLTRKPLHFEWWLHYHITLGISHFFIHIEDTPELVPFLQTEPYRSLVTISEKADGGAFKDNYWTLQDRQRAHVNSSLAKCRERGIDYLFHVDDDELIWLDKPFRDIVASAPKGTTNLMFPNLEAIPTALDPGNYFEHIHSFTKKRMLAYVNGKPAGRTLSTVKLDGPHRFSARDRPTDRPSRHHARASRTGGRRRALVGLIACAPSPSRRRRAPAARAQAAPRTPCR